MKNIAVILAGGIGKRAGEGLPKQFRVLQNGKTVLQTCVETFMTCPDMNQICVVMHPDWLEVAGEQLPDTIQLIAGGKERWESSWNAIQWLATNNAQCTMQDKVNILLHDCARPFVSQRILNDVSQALVQHEAVTVAVPATDTIYECAMHDAQCTMHDVRLVDIPDRSTMFRAQTPQAFRLGVIKQAYELALKDPNLQATDDCGIVHKYLPDTPIYIVAGEEANRKLTYQEDFL